MLEKEGGEESEMGKEHSWNSNSVIIMCNNWRRKSSSGEISHSANTLPKQEPGA